MMRLLRVNLLAIGLLVGTSGCVVEVLAPTAAGSYGLSLVNGHYAPSVVYRESSPSSSYTLEVTGGTLDLQYGGRFSMHVSMREVDGSVVSTWTEVYAGSWERAGQDVWLTYVDPVTNVEYVLNGFSRNGYLDVPVTGIVRGESVELSFVR